MKPTLILPLDLSLPTCRAAPDAALELGHFWKEIPRGFCPKAQGCEVRATLGERGEKGFYPNGVVSVENRSDATPLGLGQVLGRCPQGRRCAPTLGFGTESRWDSRLEVRLCRSNCPDTLEKRANSEVPPVVEQRRTVSDEHPGPA